MIYLARGFAPRFGGHFGKIIPRIFEINRQFSTGKAAVHPATAEYCGKAAMSRWFSFASRRRQGFGGQVSEIQNEIFSLVSFNYPIPDELERTIAFSLKIFQFFRNLNFLVENFLFYC
ncbi:MAG: hypothetical protein KY055_00860 [Candidatus Nealsonbacteria bacterium]|nr:hypothetical protein [Candidatus Nealsonbacteria bacterium]